MRKFSCFMLVSALVLFGALCYGETNSGTNAVKAVVEDLYTNDIHVVKIDNDSVSLVYETALTKKQIYDKLISWIAINYNDSKSVIQNKDPENGQIVGQGVVEYPYLIITKKCAYTMIIDIKDKKYRVQFNNYFVIEKNGDKRKFDVSEGPWIYEVQKDFITQARKMNDSLTAAKDDKDF